MSLLSPGVVAWLAAHHGVIRRSELLGLGATRHQLDYALSAGTLVARGRSVYRVAAAPETPSRRMALACAVGAGRRGLASVSWPALGSAAARSGRASSTSRSTAGRTARSRASSIHRSHRIDDVDVVERATAFGSPARHARPSTSPPRCTTTRSPRSSSSSCTRSGARSRRSSPLAGGCGEHGRNGSARFARVLQSRPALLKPVASDLELRLERALIDAGLPRPLRQHRDPAALGRGRPPDFYWPREREALEVDHVTWHGGKLDLTYDKRRDRQLWQLGIHVTPVTDDEIRHHLGPRRRPTWPPSCDLALA